MGRVLDFTDFTAEDTKRLNQIAENIKGSYTRFVDEYCKKYGDNILFWVTPFSSRNFYNDDTFLHICKILLALESVDREDIELVITETQGEYCALRRKLDGRVKLKCAKSVSIRKNFAALMNRLFHLGSYCRRQLAYIRYASRERFEYPKNAVIVIGPTISTDFHGDYFDDRYTKGINDYQDVIFLPYIVNTQNIPNKELFNHIRNCRNCKFIYDKDLLRFYDIFRILEYWNYVNSIKYDKFYYEGMDVSLIVKESLEVGKNNATSFDAVIMRRMLHRLSKKGIIVRNFIQWYEGRPFDVVVSSTIRELFPKANCVGYEGYPLIEIDPSLYISEYQYRSKHSPGRMAIPSKKYELDAHRFCKDVPLLYVPILRNEYTVKNQESHNQYRKTILLIMSYTMNVSRELLKGVWNLVKGNEKAYRIMIKNHPTNHGFKLTDYDFLEDMDVEYVEGDLNDCLANVDIAATSLTSSGMEVVFNGIPLVILYNRGQLGYTCIPGDIRGVFCTIVYSAEEMSEKLSECLTKPRADNSILEDLFIEKTRENVSIMFE